MSHVGTDLLEFRDDSFDRLEEVDCYKLDARINPGVRERAS